MRAELIEDGTIQAETLKLEFDLHNGRFENVVLKWEHGNSTWEHTLTAKEVASLAVIMERAVRASAMHNERWNAVNASIASEEEA